MNEKVEICELLTGRLVKTEESNNNRRMPKDPPDGGFRAYSVAFGSFIINGLIFGVLNFYSVIYTVLKNQLLDQNVENAESKAALVGSLAMSMTLLMSPVAGVFSDLLGLRLTAFLGGCIATTGLIISSFVIEWVEALYVTYGVMFGVGASLAYTPSLTILGHYFKRYLGRVNGVVAIGCSIFIVAMTPPLKYAVDSFGLEWAFRILALMTFGIALCGLLFKPYIDVSFEKSLKTKTTFRSSISWEIWKISRFRLWALSMPIAMFGHFVPYVYIHNFIKVNFEDRTSTLPQQCIAATSGLGRLLFGYLSDRKGINTVVLQQISLGVFGILTIAMPFITSFELLLVICLGIGLSDSGCITLIGPIAFEFCGTAYAAQAIGTIFGVSAIPLSVGPPVAGYLLKLYNSFTFSFVLAGFSTVLGATLMFIIRCHTCDKEARTNGHVTPTSDIGRRGEKNIHIMEPKTRCVDDLHGY
ncbi:unnamed protein product [Leptosia nina]|uniref:Monocarboxylate transporter 10 n=1 Tax=Leptosia nina TaxID=320188 RepID=A0AAV1K1W9_9NEOP